MDNLGKKFEQKFKEDWQKSFPTGTIYRLPDQLSGYKSYSQNPCDFFCYVNPYLFMIECKTHKGISIPFDCITQKDRLYQYMNNNGVHAGVVIWFYEKDKILFVPASVMKQLEDEGKKSISLKTIYDYPIYEIPSIKKRTFMESNYRCLYDD